MNFLFQVQTRTFTYHKNESMFYLLLIKIFLNYFEYWICLLLFFQIGEVIANNLIRFHRSVFDTVVGNGISNYSAIALQLDGICNLMLEILYLYSIILNYYLISLVKTKTKIIKNTQDEYTRFQNIQKGRNIALTHMDYE